MYLHRRLEVQLQEVAKTGAERPTRRVSALIDDILSLLLLLSLSILHNCSVVSKLALHLALTRACTAYAICVEWSGLDVEWEWRFVAVICVAVALCHISLNSTG